MGSQPKTHIIQTLKSYTFKYEQIYKFISTSSSISSRSTVWRRRRWQSGSSFKKSSFKLQPLLVGPNMSKYGIQDMWKQRRRCVTLHMLTSAPQRTKMIVELYQNRFAIL